MEVTYTSLERCSEATGTVVAIDVIRAFTTAAYAFAAGAQDILLVSTVAQAFALRDRFVGALIMGEVGGQPVEGFDFGNSPSALVGRDLSGCRLIQRTSAGTQGVVRSLRADSLLASSFACAGATARYLRQQAPGSVTFVITGLLLPHWDGLEDQACAEYIAALARGESPEVAPFIRQAQASDAARRMRAIDAPAYLRADLDCCLTVDRFDFAMLVEREDGLHRLKPVTGQALDTRGLADNTRTPAVTGLGEGAGKTC